MGSLLARNLDLLPFIIDYGFHLVQGTSTDTHALRRARRAAHWHTFTGCVDGSPPSCQGSGHASAARRSHTVLIDNIPAPRSRSYSRRDNAVDKSHFGAAVKSHRRKGERPWEHKMQICAAESSCPAFPLHRLWMFSALKIIVATYALDSHESNCAVSSTL